MRLPGGRRLSLRTQLLAGILLPVLIFVGINSVVTYRQALRAADTAYDRTLLASAKSLGEQLDVAASGAGIRLVATVPYAALEAFEADNRSQMVYKVSGFAGELVSGYPDLPAWRGHVPQQAVYAALVDFYNDEYRGRPVRVAVLLQPVAGLAGHGMATIQVAETLELRQTLAEQLLRVTLWRQAALVALIAAVVFLVVNHALRPVGELSRRLHSRSDADLAPISAPGAPAELLPLVEATNQLLSRLAQLLEQQKRFVRDTAHQLRTPLAVLKTQVQSAARGDVDPHTALREIGVTVQRATELANQMLALAKVEQLRRQADAPLLDWAGIVRAVALDLSALIADRQLDFAIETTPAPVRAHEWALRELTRNLLHNALRHTPPVSALLLRLGRDGDFAVLTVADSGPGIGAEQRQRLFQPFSAGAVGGSGLGLAICHDIVMSLDGRIELVDREAKGHVTGLDAVVRLPIADNRGR